MSDDTGTPAAKEAAALAANDPFALARRDLRQALPRRFYAAAEAGPLPARPPAGPSAGGFGVFLDGRPVRTPAKAPLAVPTAALAEALAAEWQAQGEVVEPDTMPLTRLCNSAIDGVAAAMEATAAEVARFAETDLLCYRAADPAALVAEQAAAWDPVLALVEARLKARFVLVEGVMYAAQPEGSLAAVRGAVDALAGGEGGAIRLAALSVMTSLAGSVLLALAVAWDVLAVADAWTAAHVDEDYQMRLWGSDAEALERRERRRRDMAAAATACRLLRAGGPA